MIHSWDIYMLASTKKQPREEEEKRPEKGTNSLKNYNL